MFEDNAQLKIVDCCYDGFLLFCVNNMICKKNTGYAKIVELFPAHWRVKKTTCSNVLALVVSAHVKLKSTLLFDSLYVNFSSCQLQVAR